MTCSGCDADPDPDTTNGLVPWAHRCCQCRDSRLVRGNYPLDDSRFGKTVACPCTLSDDRPNERFLLRSGIPPNYATATVAGIKSLHVRQWAADYTGRFPPERPFALLTGGVGTGKTYAASAVLTDIHGYHNYFGRFHRAIGLLKRYKATFDDDATETARAIDEEMMLAPILVLDDLGAEKESEWTHEQIYDLLDRRYGRQMPTIVTTNTPIDQLEPRVIDRLQDQRLSTVVQFDGPSRRLES